ncbi:sulfurtransferase [Vagococcus penaei]|uniref:Sulfurtransferase n=1 Tax=Vagococcus penaei TaxID=633807 RepID=A0A1Q2D4I3_9ENTE|nr:rhodanese-like domain-containing protein [Vagococcus penaei]AQP53185.1 sulfurtransferase [Vagococcus penaei]RSU00986.1 sulfurtransferase [Vagococcus penaei]
MGFIYTLNAIIIITLIGIGLYQLYFYLKLKASAKYITQEELQENMRKGQLIDVREKEEFNRGHILGARSVPYTIARAHKEYLTAIRKDSPVYLYDNKKVFSINMASLLKKEGYTDIYVLKGGYSNWTGKTKKK